MNSHSSLSKQAKSNWLVDSLLLTAGLAAALSGIYFLYSLQGGYRGGRNPAAPATLLFSREGWNSLHTWSGVLLIAAAVIHLAVHWPWVVSMVCRAWREVAGRGVALSPRGRQNLALNLALGISALLTALSGVYFLFATGGHADSATVLLFSRATWNLIHTWAGAAAIACAILHFAIHWHWVTNVTARLVSGLVPARALAQTVTVLSQDSNRIR